MLKYHALNIIFIHIRRFKVNCLSDLNNESSLFYLFYRWKSLYVFVGPTKTTLNKGFRTKLYISFFPHFLSFAENIGYPRRLSIKSSESLENKGFIAMCPPYPFIRFHTFLPLPQLLIRAKARARKSHNKI